MNSLNLIADVGGTNARFALVEKGSLAARRVDVLRCADFPSPVEAVETYLQQNDSPRIDRAVFALATPITGKVVMMTNSHWQFSVDQLAEVFAIPSVRLVNDFTALALAIPHLSAEEQFEVGGGQVKAGAPMAIIGPGTGLGVSGLVADGHGGWVAISGEGGHVTVAARNRRESQVIEHLQYELDHVSAERLLSGPGLTRLYSTLQAVDQQPVLKLEPAEIVQRALTGNEYRAMETLNIFCSQLGACAGNLALTLGAEGGVYIGGGIVPRMRDYLVKSQFRTAFEDKGRMAVYLKAMPTRIVTAEYPALTGLASLLR